MTPARAGSQGGSPLAMVDINELLRFVFPRGLQHPLSTGRLYAFALYGPLDENAHLRAGLKGTRPVSPWELDTLCLQLEREDILQVRRTTWDGIGSPTQGRDQAITRATTAGVVRKQQQMIFVLVRGEGTLDLTPLCLFRSSKRSSSHERYSCGVHRILRQSNPVLFSFRSTYPRGNHSSC